MDQDLRDLTEQIRDLVEILQSNSRTGGTSSYDTANKDGEKFVRGVDRMVVALGKLAVQLDATKKNRVTEEEAIKKFTKAVEKTAEKLDDEEKARQDAIRAQEELTRAQEEAARRSSLTQKERDKEDAARNNAEAIQAVKNLRLSKTGSQELYDSLSGTGTTADILKSKFLGLSGESVVAHGGLQLFSAGLEGAGKGLTTFAKGLMQGQRGPELTAKAVKDFTDPLFQGAEQLSSVLTLLSFIPGPIMGIARGVRIALAGLLWIGSKVGKAAVEFNQINAEQVTKVFKSFNQLSASGIGLSTGLEGTIDLVHKLNLSVAEIEQFNQLLGQNSKSLALMGGTAAKGAEKFAGIAGALARSDLGRTFEVMGITQDEQREAALLYMSIQARTGQLQLKNTQQLVDGSANFVRELDLAAQLTGASRKEQQDAREAAMTEQRYRAARAEAERMGDKKWLAQLDAAEKAAGLARTIGDVRGATGILQIAAGRGALSTPEAVAAEITYQVSRILANPNMGMGQMFNQMSNAIEQNSRSLGPLNTVAGEVSALQTNLIANLTQVERNRVLAESAKEAGFGTDQAAIDKYLASDAFKRSVQQRALPLVVDAGRKNLETAQMFDQGVSMFGTAANIHAEASEKFNNAVTALGNALGVKVAGSTGGTSTGGAPGAKGSGTTSNSSASNYWSGGRATKPKNEPQMWGGTSKGSMLGVPDTGFSSSVGGSSMLSSPGQILNPGSAAKILDLVGKVESGGNYNVLVGGKTEPNLTNMTVAEVLAFQQQKMGKANGFESTAVGKYQIINSTLDGLVKRGFVSPHDKFSPETQDKLGMALLELRGWSKFQRGKITVDQMADSIAKEWASFPLSNNRSYYADVGSNKALVDRHQVVQTLSSAPHAMHGGMFSGPMTGYPAVLHGTEAVIPLKDGMVPVSMPSLDELVTSNRAVDAQVQVLRTEIGAMMREIATALANNTNNEVQERMIQLLENISRSQQTTANASRKMAQLAAN